MYTPPSFKIAELEALIDFIKAHPLGLLISSGASGLLASPVPFLYRPHNTTPTLVCHLARANKHWHDLQNITECLVVFQGVQNYITPSWYPSKQEHQKVVPTWNYEMVQVSGTPKVIEDAAWLAQQIADVTNTMEHMRPANWKVTDAPQDFVDSQIKAIVGIEFTITDFKGKSKMSQNRNAADQQGVIKGLNNEADPHHNQAAAEKVASRTRQS